MSPFNPVSYRGPTGNMSDPESAALVAAYRARFAPAAPIIALYTDGGVIGQNPSPIGGTWAWCVVDANGQQQRHASGWMSPAEMDADTVTNNHTELLALVLGLEALDEGFAGTVYSDSWVSLQRVFLAAKLNNVPAWLVDRLQAIQKSGRLATVSYKLLDGHPTKAQLEAGIGKRGNPVSAWNVWCDEQCSAVAREVSAR
jgi:ribonuclease HI